jgi:hypothetical protein
MPTREHAGAVLDFPAAAASALQDAAARCRPDVRGVQLILLFGTAVYHLLAAGAVVRIGLQTPPRPPGWRPQSR